MIQQPHLNDRPQATCNIILSAINFSFAINVSFVGILLSSPSLPNIQQWVQTPSSTFLSLYLVVTELSCFVIVVIVHIDVIIVVVPSAPTSHLYRNRSLTIQQRKPKSSSISLSLSSYHGIYLLHRCCLRRPCCCCCHFGFDLSPLPLYNIVKCH